MQNLIPVAIILGVLGLILWKNWARVVQIADKFTNRGQDAKPDNGTTQPESGAPYKVPDVAPAPVEVSKPEVSIPQADKPAPTPEELHAQSQDFIRRATGWNEDSAKLQDAAYARYQANRSSMLAEKGAKEWDDQFPKSVPNLTVPNLSTSRHVIKLDKGGIKFLVFIPDPDKWVSLRIATDVVLWAGKFGNNPGHATIRDSQNNLVDERRLPLEGIVFQFSPVDRKGCTKLDRGTYEVSISYVGTTYPFVESYIDIKAK